MRAILSKLTRLFCICHVPEFLEGLCSHNVPQACGSVRDLCLCKFLVDAAELGT